MRVVISAEIYRLNLFELQLVLELCLDQSNTVRSKTTARLSGADAALRRPAAEVMEESLDAEEAIDSLPSRPSSSGRVWLLSAVVAMVFGLSLKIGMEEAVARAGSCLNVTGH